MRGDRWRNARVAAWAFVLLAFAFPSGEAVAGGWTEPAGKFYNRTSVNRYFADREFDGDGERHDLLLDAEFRDLNVADYFELGLTDRFTAVASGSVKFLRTENLARVIEARGIGDIELALRCRLLEGKAGVTSVQVLTKVPGAYDAHDVLPLGNGQRELDAHLAYGRSLWPVIPGYCGLELGYRLRDGEPANELRYLVELGSDVGAGCYVRSKLDGTRGERTEVIYDSNLNPTLRGSSDVGALDLTLGRHFGPHYALEAGFATALYGRTTTAGSTFTLALACTGRLWGAQ